MVFLVFLFWIALIFVGAFSVNTFAADTKYQLPAPELQALVDAPRGPEFSLGPRNRTALLLNVPRLPSISELSQPELKLAGLRY